MFTSSLKILHVIDCTKPCDKIRAQVDRKSYGFFSILIDFCIEFWNSTSPPVLEFTGKLPVVQTPDVWLLPFKSYSSVSCGQLNLDIL